MFLTNPLLEVQDARTHLVSPYRIWDLVAATDTEPCFVVSMTGGECMQALTTTTMISSIERLLSYTAGGIGKMCQVFLLEKQEDRTGRRRLRFQEISGIGTYEAEPKGVPFYAHQLPDGSYQQTYDAQPLLRPEMKVEVVALFEYEDAMLRETPLNTEA